MDVIISDESSGSESGSSDSDDYSAFMEHMNVMSIGAKPYQFEPVREDINGDDNSLVSSNEDENEDHESRFKNLNW